MNRKQDLIHELQQNEHIIHVLSLDFALYKIDEHFGATQALIRAYRRLGHTLEEIKSDIEAAKYEVNRNLNFLERNPQFIPCLFAPCTGIRGF